MLPIRSVIETLSVRIQVNPPLLTCPEQISIVWGSREFGVGFSCYDDSRQDKIFVKEVLKWVIKGKKTRVVGR